MLTYLKKDLWLRGPLQGSLFHCYACVLAHIVFRWFVNFVNLFHYVISLWHRTKKLSYLCSFSWKVDVRILLFQMAKNLYLSFTRKWILKSNLKNIWRSWKNFYNFLQNAYCDSLWRRHYWLQEKLDLDFLFVVLPEHFWKDCFSSSV